MRNSTAPIDPRLSGRSTVATRRGAIATQTALVVPAIVGFTALAVDAAYLYNEEAHQQGVMDAAALAGASGFLEGESTIIDRAMEIVSHNTSIAGEPYTLEADDIELGYWEAGAFVPASYSVARESERPAVRVVSEGHPTSLFFAQLFAGSATTPVATAAIAARMTVGQGPPANCGILADASLSIGGSQVTDGYMSDDCQPDSAGYDPANADPETGVCSNADVTVFGGAGNNLYAQLSWGPEGDVDINGQPAMHGDRTQLAQEVTVPTPETCTVAEQAASDQFLAAPGACLESGALRYNASTRDLSVGNGILRIHAGCNAPTTLCVDDLTLGSNGALYTDGGSYGDGGSVAIKASGDLSMTGLAKLTNVTDTNPVTGISTGNAAGALRLHFQGDVDIRGTTDLSAIVTAGGDIELNGDADLFGALFSDGAIDLSGNFDVHVDRCYELSSTLGNADTDTVLNPKLVLVK
jgi:hypothetical protein